MLLDTTQLAARLGKKPKTLDNWRSQGIGPPHRKIVGSIRYDESDVDVWLNSCKKNSTADTQSKAAA